MNKVKKYTPVTLILSGLTLGIVLTDVTQPVTPIIVVAFLLIATGITMLATSK